MKTIDCIDLFCGIGGLSYGLKEAGVNVVAGVDIDKSCKFAYEENCRSHFIEADISNLKSNEIKEFFAKDHISAIVGCAPCQPFSKYSQRYRKEGHTNEKWKLLYSFARIVSDVQPDIISMENVPELQSENVFIDFIHTLETLKYNIWHSVVNCPEYGVPQSRRRLVLLASKVGEIRLLPPEFDVTSYKTVRDTIANLVKIEDGESDKADPLHCASKLSEKNKIRITSSQQGGTWLDWDLDLRLPCHSKETGRTYSSVYGRMSWDMPAPTITTQFFGYGNGRFGHPEQNRGLSIREGAMLQSFPVDYIFLPKEEVKVNKTRLGIQIGNAVPPKLGEVIGRSIIASLQ